MKKNFYLILLLIMGVFLFLPNGVKAEENYSITTKIEDEGTVSATLIMQLNGAEKPTGEGMVSYYVKFVNEGTSKPTDATYENLVRSDSTDNKDITKWKSVLYTDTKGYTIYISDDWFLLKGYNYAYVAKCESFNSTENCTVTNTPIEVMKPALPAYEKRYDAFVFSGYDENGDKNSNHEISIFDRFPSNGENGSHKHVVKFGKVTDTTIINKYANKSTDAISSLLNYAQNAQDQTYIIDDSDKYDITPFKPDFNAFYYLYINYENTDGLYRDLSDIYLGKFDVGGNFSVYDFKSGTITSTSTTKVENPKTADINVLMYVGILIIISGGLIISYKKFKSVK